MEINTGNAKLTSSIEVRIIFPIFLTILTFAKGELERFIPVLTGVELGAVQKGSSVVYRHLAPSIRSIRTFAFLNNSLQNTAVLFLRNINTFIHRHYGSKISLTAKWNGKLMQKHVVSYLPKVFSRNHLKITPVRIEFPSEMTTNKKKMEFFKQTQDVSISFVITDYSVLE